METSTDRQYDQGSQVADPEFHPDVDMYGPDISAPLVGGHQGLQGEAMEIDAPTEME